MEWHRSALAVLTLSAVLALAACSKNAEPPAALSAPPQGSGASQPSGPPVNQIAADLPLLPMGIINSVRPVEVVKASYEFAARHPEVLKYVPCFCGCERGGHQGNHDCFIAGRSAAGEVTDWDVHAIGCEICIDVAYEAKQMHDSGASVGAIRKAIDAKYAHLPYTTPTPMPGTGSGGH